MLYEEQINSMKMKTNQNNNSIPKILSDKVNSNDKLSESKIISKTLVAIDYEELTEIYQVEHQNKNLTGRMPERSVQKKLWRH